MNRYFKFLILVVFFSFAWGAWWGFYKVELERPPSEKGPIVRVLAEEGYFTADFVRFFHNRYEVQLKVTEMGSVVTLIRELLSNGSTYDLIQVPSFIGRSFLLDNVFSPIERSEISRLDDISVDFRALDYDPDDKFLVPLTWGLNGFVVNSEVTENISETLTSILEHGNSKKRVSVLPYPEELLAMVAKIKPIVRTWVETGNETELKKEIRGVKQIIRHFSTDPRQSLEGGESDIGQVANGFVAEWIANKANFRYVLPQEKASLWIRAMGISLGSKDKALSHRILNYLLDPAVNEEFVRQNQQATTLTTVNERKLPPLQRAGFIRMIPLSRVELLMSTDALEPLWLRTVADEVISSAR